MKSILSRSGKMSALFIVLCALTFAPALPGSGTSSSAKALSEWVINRKAPEVTGLPHKEPASQASDLTDLTVLHTASFTVRYKHLQSKHHSPVMHRLHVYQRIHPDEDLLS